MTKRRSIGLAVGRCGRLPAQNSAWLSCAAEYIHSPLGRGSSDTKPSCKVEYSDQPKKMVLSFDFNY